MKNEALTLKNKKGVKSEGVEEEKEKCSNPQIEKSIKERKGRKGKGRGGRKGREEGREEGRGTAVFFQLEKPQKHI